MNKINITTFVGGAPTEVEYNYNTDEEMKVVFEVLNEELDSLFKENVEQKFIITETIQNDETKSAMVYYNNNFYNKNFGNSGGYAGEKVEVEDLNQLKEDIANGSFNPEKKEWQVAKKVKKD